MVSDKLGFGFQDVWLSLESDVPRFKFGPSCDLRNPFHLSEPQFPYLLSGQEINHVKAYLGA